MTLQNAAYGLDVSAICLWRLERFEEAEAVFERLLCMNPSGNLGIRFLLPQVRGKKHPAQAVVAYLVTRKTSGHRRRSSSLMPARPNASLS
jgi:tetratricopeptide (TPR) repeat protein